MSPEELSSLVVCLSRIFSEVASFHQASVACEERSGEWIKKCEEKLTAARNLLDGVSNADITRVLDEFMENECGEYRARVIMQFLYRYLKWRFDFLRRRLGGSWYDTRTPWR